MTKTLIAILLATQVGGADFYTWMSLLLVPITGVVSWFAGKRVRNNSTLQQLQGTIDMLVEKNSVLYAQILELNSQLAEVRKENAELKAGQERMSGQLSAVQRENAGLKKQLESIKKGQSIIAKK